jgi:hypothetical protein
VGAAPAPLGHRRPDTPRRVEGAVVFTHGGARKRFDQTGRVDQILTGLINDLATLRVRKPGGGRDDSVSLIDASGAEVWR